MSFSGGVTFLAWGFQGIFCNADYESAVASCSILPYLFRLFLQDDFHCLLGLREGFWYWLPCESRFGPLVGCGLWVVVVHFIG